MTYNFVVIEGKVKYQVFGSNFAGNGLKGVLHPCTLFFKILCVFSKNKATLDKVFNGSDTKCSKELKNHSFISVDIMVVKLL